MKISNTEILDYLKTEKLKVSVFGEFSCGKTTFLNALINENILTVAYEPTTAVPTRIRYAKLFNIIVFKNSGHKKKFFDNDTKESNWRRFVGRKTGSNILSLLEKTQSDIHTFLKEWTKEGEKADKVKEVIIELPIPWLKSGIELIDTPGTNNEYTNHRRFTENVAEETDIAIMLLRAIDGGASKTEYAFMNKVNKAVYESMIVINMMDLVDTKEEREEVISYLCNESIPQHWEHPINPKVYGISAELQVNQIKCYQAKELLEEYDRFIADLKLVTNEKRGNILLKRLGNPDKELFSEAKKLEKSINPNDTALADDKYQALKDILSAAGVSTKPADDGMDRCFDIAKELSKRTGNLIKKYKSINKKEYSLKKYLSKITDISNQLQKMNHQESSIEKAISKTKSKLEKIENIKKRINHLIKGIRSNLKSQDYQNYQIPEAAKKMSEIKELINEVDLTKTQLETINDLNKKLNKQNNIYFANIKRRNTKAFKEKNVRTSLKLLKEIERHLIALTTYEYLEQYKVFLPDIFEKIRSQIQEKNNIQAARTMIAELNSNIELITTTNDISDWEQGLKNVPYNLPKTNYSKLLAAFEERKNIVLDYDRKSREYIANILKIINKGNVLYSELVKSDAMLEQQKITGNIIGINLSEMKILGKGKKWRLDILNIEQNIIVLDDLLLLNLTKDDDLYNTLMDKKLELSSKMKAMIHNTLTGILPSMHQIDWKNPDKYVNNKYLFIDDWFYCRKCEKKYKKVGNVLSHCKICLRTKTSGSSVNIVDSSGNITDYTTLNKSNNGSKTLLNKAHIHFNYLEHPVYHQWLLYLMEGIVQRDEIENKNRAELKMLKDLFQELYFERKAFSSEIQQILHTKLNEQIKIHNKRRVKKYIYLTVLASIVFFYIIYQIDQKSNDYKVFDNKVQKLTVSPKSVKNVTALSTLYLDVINETDKRKKILKAVKQKYPGYKVEGIKQNRDIPEILGRYYLDQNDLGVAETFFDKITDVNKKNKYYRKLFKDYLKKDLYNKAEIVTKKMVVMDRNKSYADLADKFIRRSELDKATTYVDKITDVNKKDQFYGKLFGVYLKKDLYNKAEIVTKKISSKSLMLQSKSRAALNKSYSDLADKFIKRSELDKAITYVDKLTDENKKNKYYRKLFKVYLKKDLYNKAEIVTKKMVVMDRNKSYADLADKFIRRSELDKATTYVDKITDVNKKDILYESIFNKYLSKVIKNMEKKGRFSFKESHTSKSIYFKKKAEKVIKKIRSNKKQNKLSKKLKKLD